MLRLRCERELSWFVEVGAPGALAETVDFDAREALATNARRFGGRAQAGRDVCFFRWTKRFRSCSVPSNDRVALTMKELQVQRCLQGRDFAPDELSLVREVVKTCAGLSRTELALTVCELLDWKRPNGELKARECRDVLEELEHCGWLELPQKRPGRPRGLGTAIPRTAAGEPGEPVVGVVGDFEPIELKRVDDDAGQCLFRELVGRYHYLGFRVPFGAQLRYLVWISRPETMVVGAIQFSSPAWRMAARDRWVGWDDETRRRNLQRVVNNSRFLLLPWVRVKNLASRVLSLAAGRLRSDWPERYGTEPFLVETLVDSGQYRGSCYRAANWMELGSTTGRGRMDRRHERHGSAPKAVLVYPLVRHAARRLREV